ncbi:unnamed protein product [Closterium sp. NIES-53]
MPSSRPTTTGPTASTAATPSAASTAATRASTAATSPTAATTSTASTSSSAAPTTAPTLTALVGFLRVFASLPPSPAPLCTPCVEGRLRATPHSSSLRPTTAPFQTLNLDVWGRERESFFLVVIDDYSCYTTVFPLAKKYDVTSTLIRWLLATEATRGSRVVCLHSDCGGEFRSSILRGFCSEQGITQSWMLLESPQQNGVAERRIGASLTSLWTGSPGVASVFLVWGCLALVRDTSGISSRLAPSPVSSLVSKWTLLTTPFTTRPSTSSLTLTTSGLRSVSYYTQYPCQGIPDPPLPLFLAPTPPPAPVPPVHPPSSPPPCGPALFGVSHATPLPSLARQVLSPSPHSSSQSPQRPSVLPRQVAVDSGGVVVGGASTLGAGTKGAGVEGASAGGAGCEGAGAEGGASWGAGDKGAISEETGAREATTPAPAPPPHRYPTRH